MCIYIHIYIFFFPYIIYCIAHMYKTSYIITSETPSSLEPFKPKFAHRMLTTAKILQLDTVQDLRVQCLEFKGSGFRKP